MDEKIYFNALNLSDEEAKYIEIDRKGVCLRFPLMHSLKLAIGHENSTSPEPDANARFQKMMTEFWDEEAGKEGVSLKARLNNLSEAEFFKEAITDEEIKNTVLSLVKLKRRFGIA